MTDKTEKPASPVIQGGASVTPAPIPVVVHATWADDVENKRATATILGGEATIFRKADGKLAGRWERPMPASGEDEQDGKLVVSIPLHNYTSVAQAKERCEVLIREGFQKTHPQLADEATKVEQAERLSGEPETW